MNAITYKEEKKQEQRKVTLQRIACTPEIGFYQCRDYTEGVCNLFCSGLTEECREGLKND